MAKRRIWDKYGEAYKPSDRIKGKKSKQTGSGEVGVVQGDGGCVQLEFSFELIDHPIPEYRPDPLGFISGH